MPTIDLSTQGEELNQIDGTHMVRIVFSLLRIVSSLSCFCALTTFCSCRFKTTARNRLVSSSSSRIEVSICCLPQRRAIHEIFQHKPSSNSPRLSIKLRQCPADLLLFWNAHHRGKSLIFSPTTTWVDCCARRRGEGGRAGGGGATAGGGA